MLTRNKLSTAVKAAVLIGGSLTAMNTIAQEAIEEVVVTGIRASLQDAMATKRNSDAVVDAVSAEDVGKFPDSDVGEALARIPGITVNRQFGQGQQVSIRGASNKLTLTTLNGQNVASTGWYDQQDIDRSFNYTLLPSELIGGIEVYKSSQADLLEGGIGGTVVVKTAKPLDLDSGTAFISAENTYGSMAGANSPAISGLYSMKSEDETFGVLVAVSQKDVEYHRRGTEAYTAWNDSVSVNAFEQNREQTSISLAAQWQPSDKLELGAEYLSLDMSADNSNNSLFIFRSANAANCDQANGSGLCVLETTDAANPNANPAWAQTFARKASMSSETFNVNAKFDGDDYQVTLVAGTTDAQGGTDSTANYGGLIGTLDQVYGEYDSRGKEIKMDLADPRWDVQDFVTQGNQTLSSAGWAATKGPNSDSEDYFQGDIEFDVEVGAVNSIKTGVRWSDHSVEKTQYNGVFENGVVGADIDYLFDGVTKSGMQDYYIPAGNLNNMVADTESQATYYANRQAYGNVEEENFSAYVMATFEADAIRGNFGVRYISTDVSADYYGADPTYVDPNGVNTGRATAMSTDSADYSDFLPSINLAMDLTDDVVVRASLAQVIARPNYADMFVGESVSNYGDVNPLAPRTAVRGSVDLDPFKATQMDLSAEWYYGEGNMASATLFRKDISNFTTSKVRSNVSLGLVDPITGVDSWELTEKANGKGGTITGLELQVQHAWDNGFGSIANYTYADSDVDASNYSDMIPTSTDSSEHTLNLVGYYEADNYSARAAYNWRSEYMIREAGFYGNRLHDDFGTLDLSFNYYVTDAITLSFDAVNVLEEDSVQLGAADSNVLVKSGRYEFNDGYPAFTFQGEAFYTVGISARF